MISQTSHRERLRTIDPEFDASVLDTVSEVAKRFCALPKGEVLRTLPATSVYNVPGTRQTLEILDIRPNEHDSTIVFHQPMSGVLTPDRRLRMETLAACLPHTRVITAGNPGDIGNPHGRLPFRSLPSVARGGLGPTVAGTLRYVYSQGIEIADQAGASYGADKAAAAAGLAHEYSLETKRLVSIDPASVTTKSLRQLLVDFRSTESALASYIQGSGWPEYRKTRESEDGLLSYKLGLFRLSNIAASRCLSGGGFRSRLEDFLYSAPDAHASVIWAGESELCDDASMQDLIAATNETFPNRVRGHRVPNQRHAFTNDPFIQAALVLQGLRDASASDEPKQP
jgi:hypothetical protein